MQMIVDRVPHGRLQVFENSGHCLFLEDAPAFNRCLDEFVTELGQR